VAIRGRAHANAVSSLEGLEGVDGAAGRAAVWGGTRTLSTGYAALANGIAAHVLDFDDTHTDSIVHGSAIVAPVAMALGEERGASGADLIAAFVAGWRSRHAWGSPRTAASTSAASTPPRSRASSAPPRQRPACCTSMPATTAHALALAGSQASGINEYLSNSSSAKSLHTGWSAHAGMLAAILAQSGMTGPMSVFDGRDGVLRAFGLPDESDAARLDADLGSRWETTRISIKPYPCCHFARTRSSTAWARSWRRAWAAADIAALHCVVPEIEVALICEPFEPKLKPTTPYAAKFSLPWLLAARIADGRLDHASFEPASIAREELLALAARVTYRVAAPGETPFPRTFPGWVEATLRDGRKWSSAST
jgi:2-methylcitrate dehydratase PrpD